MIELKKFRKANHLTQDEMGEILGVKKSFISKVENGKEKLPETWLDLILGKTNWEVPADVFIMGEMIKQSGGGIDENGNFKHAGESDSYGEIAALKEKIELLERLLEEKERTIKILMGRE